MGGKPRTSTSLFHEEDAAMSNKKTGSWTRRRLLKTFPAALAPALIPGRVRAALPSVKPAAPFSRFVDVAR
jgi:hypothetical protein